MKRSAAISTFAIALLFLASPVWAQTTQELTVTPAWGSKIQVSVVLPADATPRPVVLVQHGILDSRNSFLSLGEHLTQSGFAAVVIQQPNRVDVDPEPWAQHVHEVIDAIEAANATPTSPLYHRLDLDRLGIVGHSQGGATAIMASADDPRIKATVALAPGSLRKEFLDWAPRIKVPFLVVGADNDPIVPPAKNALPAFERAKNAVERLYVEITGGDHFSFMDHSIANIGLPWLRRLLPRFFHRVGDEQRGIAWRYATAWLEKHLGIAGYDASLTDGTEARRDLASGVLGKVAFESSSIASDGLPVPGPALVTALASSNVGATDAERAQLAQAIKARGDVITKGADASIGATGALERTLHEASAEQRGVEASLR
jgi:dienelactone hydrolase